MKSHVNGQAQVAPSAPSLNALRCELLAVLIGNYLFTNEEQLRANHHAHECESPQRLALWLCNVRREAERRQRVIELQAQACQQVGGYDKEAQISELHQLAQCRALSCTEQSSIHLLPMWDVSRLEAVSLVGRYYVKALRRAGKLPEHGI